MGLPVNDTNAQLDIEWQKAGQTITMENLREDTFLQLQSNGRRLNMLSVRTSDAGRYTCIVRNVAGEARKTFDVKVLVSAIATCRMFPKNSQNYPVSNLYLTPPTIVDALSSDTLQTVIPGSRVSLTCDVEGSPQPEIMWTRNGEPIVDSDKMRLMNQRETLIIHDVTEADGGEYSCQADNKAGQAARNFVLRLTGPPVVDQGHELLDVVSGDSMTLKCRVVSGTGQISVNWLIDGKPVENGEHSPTVQVLDRQIQVNEARLSDSGKYICVVKNEAGEARKTFDLSVLEIPRFLDTTNTKPSIIIDRPQTLDCSVSGTPKSVITWMKVGELAELN